MDGPFPKSQNTATSKAVELFGFADVDAVRVSRQEEFFAFGKF